jgi:hypothetical protein
MQRTPKNTVILHWEEHQSEWTELPWRDWLRFRGFAARESSLTGAHAGDHYFLICLLESTGCLANLIPHRYAMSTGGGLSYGFDGLEETEREEFYRLKALRWPTPEESKIYDDLGARAFAVNLPPAHTVQALLRALPGLAGAQHDAPCWRFLSAIGICRPGRRAS